MTIQFLDKTKKRKLLNQLWKEFGISDLNYLLMKSGNDKIRIYSGNLSKDELNELSNNIYLEMLGIRFGTIEKDGIRISFDVLNIPEIKKQITKWKTKMEPFGLLKTPRRTRNRFFGLLRPLKFIQRQFEKLTVEKEIPNKMATESISYQELLDYKEYIGIYHNLLDYKEYSNIIDTNQITDYQEYASIIDTNQITDYK